MEQQQRWVLSVEIDQMTVDLFRFWLNRDWPTIVGNLQIMDAKETDPAKYKGDWFVLWSSDSKEVFISTINWAQLHIDKIIVEWTGIDTLSDQIQSWLESRFNIDVKKK